METQLHYARGWHGAVPCPRGLPSLLPSLSSKFAVIFAQRGSTGGCRGAVAVRRALPRRGCAGSEHYVALSWRCVPADTETYIGKRLITVANFTMAQRPSLAFSLRHQSADSLSSSFCAASCLRVGQECTYSKQAGGWGGLRNNSGAEEQEGRSLSALLT